MAKGKHAAALFEVINRGDRNDRPASGALRTPKWWFRGKRSASAPAVTPSPTASAPLDASGNGMVSLPNLTSISGTRSRFQIEVDSSRHQVTLRMSTTAAILTAFVIAVSIGLAYFVGRQTGPSAVTPLLSDRSTEELRALPPQLGVLDLQRRGSSEPDEVSQDVAAREQPGGAMASVAPTFNEPRPPATLVVQEKQRTVGLNYVIIQSYPAKEEALARDAAKILNDRGVACSIEKGVKGWGADWYCVVGYAGFNRISSPEYKKYIEGINKISDEFARNKSFKAFAPQAIRWSS